MENSDKSKLKIPLSRTEALAIAEKCAYVLKGQFGVKKVYIFGSVTGVGPWHDRSDIDIAVEGLAPEDYFRALSALDEYLPSSLEIDLITLESAFPEMSANIRGERKMPKGPVEAMKQRIVDELTALDRITRRLQTSLKQISDCPNELERRGIATYVHDFYNGVERIFKRIAVTLNGSLPKGEHWHQELLEQMKKEQPGIRPPVIDDALYSRLLDYLEFRHRFRNIYGDELLWTKLCPKVENIPDILAQLREQLVKIILDCQDCQNCQGMS